MSPTKDLFLNRNLFFCVVMVLVLSGYDAVATMHHIGRGVATEANPLMDSLIQRSAVLFFLVKMAITATCMVICYNYSHRKAARAGIHLAVGMYVVLFVYHAMISLFA
ncbi:MAG: hypothetical protein HY231_16580 [Acidobacteria bacterium]|nr:hypothetical protein [Acidobacteriota bacterium]